MHKLKVLLLLHTEHQVVLMRSIRLALDLLLFSPKTLVVSGEGLLGGLVARQEG